MRMIQVCLAVIFTFSSLWHLGMVLESFELAQRGWLVCSTQSQSITRPFHRSKIELLKIKVFQVQKGAGSPRASPKRTGRTLRFRATSTRFASVLLDYEFRSRISSSILSSVLRPQRLAFPLRRRCPDDVLLSDAHRRSRRANARCVSPGEPPLSIAGEATMG